VDARASGELLYNAAYDTHWNARGARTAGHALAVAMRASVEAEPYVVR